MEQIAFNLGLQRRSFTVSELTAEMRALLAGEFTDIYVAGEISGMKLAASGHYYFTLKDSLSQLRCVCYKMTARYLRFKPQDGAAVIARGHMTTYCRSSWTLTFPFGTVAGGLCASSPRRTISMGRGT